jgi:hypothetical protein
MRDNNWRLVLILLLLAGGCSKSYWLADPYLERFLLANPPQKINVTTEPRGARVVITSLRNAQIYAGYAPVNIRYRPHPYVPSWILVGKEGYRSTAIKIDKDARETRLHIVLAMLTKDEINQLDIMAGPMMGRPSMPQGVPGRLLNLPF